VGKVISQFLVAEPSKGDEYLTFGLIRPPKRRGHIFSINSLNNLNQVVSVLIYKLPFGSKYGSIKRLSRPFVKCSTIKCNSITYLTVYRNIAPLATAVLC
jgi:hypothetical protein